MRDMGDISKSRINSGVEGFDVGGASNSRLIYLGRYGEQDLVEAYFESNGFLST